MYVLTPEVLRLARRCPSAAYNILYYTILYYIILYYTILYYTKIQYTMI